MKKTLYQVVGAVRQFDFNKRQGRIRLAERSDSLKVCYVENDDWVPLEPGQAVDAPLPYEGAMAVLSDRVGLHYAILQNVLTSDEVIDELHVEFYALYVGIDIDADRDGKVGIDEPGKANWVWGKGQPGAIVLVNNNRDLSDVAPKERANSELADLLVRPVGSAPAGVELNLYAAPDNAQRLSVYRKDGDGRLQRILGRGPKNDGAPPIMDSPPLALDGEHCYIEAHEYPGPFFDGLLTIELFIRAEGRLIGRDRVVFRVSPWMMTPNTLTIEQVYACDVTTDDAPNSEFLSGLKEACERLRVPLMVIPPTKIGGLRTGTETAGYRTRWSLASATARRTFYLSYATARVTAGWTPSLS